MIAGTYLSPQPLVDIYRNPDNAIAYLGYIYDSFGYRMAG